MSQNSDIPPKYTKHNLADFPSGISKVLLPFFSGEKLSVFLHGGIGSHKSTLAAAILTAWRNTGKPSFDGTRWGEFVAVYKLSHAAKDFDCGKERMDFWKLSPILILDDVGSNRDTDFLREQILFLLQYRYDYNLPIVVTSNLNLSGFAGHVDPRASSRLQEGIVLNMGNSDARK